MKCKRAGETTRRSRTEEANMTRRPGVHIQTRKQSQRVTRNRSTMACALCTPHNLVPSHPHQEQSLHRPSRTAFQLHRDSAATLRLALAHFLLPAHHPDKLHLRITHLPRALASGLAPGPSQDATQSAASGLRTTHGCSTPSCSYVAAPLPAACLGDSGSAPTERVIQKSGLQSHRLRCRPVRRLHGGLSNRRSHRHTRRS